MLLSRETTKEVVMLLPNLALLVGRLAMDKRVPWETKAALGAAAAYIISPIDGIPDFIPVVGPLEDILIALLVMDGIVNQLDPDIVQQHWGGSPDTLRRLGRIAATATGFIPAGIKDTIMRRTFRGRAGRILNQVARASGK